MATIKKFSGINNIDSDEQLEDSELRAAKNIDISRKGKLSRRDGFSKVYIGTNVHSVWSDGTTTPFVEDGVLKTLASDNTATTIRSDVTRFGTMSYYAVNGSIYYTDGTVTGIYNVDEGSKPLGLPTPFTRPVLTSVSGVLPAGQYGVAFTVADASGMESGATISTWIELPNDGSGITVSGISVPADASYVNVYMTNTDGDTLFLAESTTDSSVTITHPPQGAAVRTQFLDAMPAGNIIAYHKGRTLVARGNFIVFSEPHSLLTRLTQNFVMFPSTVNMIAPVEDGIFISCEGGKTYHVFGTDPMQWAMTEKADYAAIKGTAVLVNPELLPGEFQEEGWVWLSEKGICIGAAGGSFQNITSTKYGVKPSTIGTAMLMQRDGHNRYVSTLHPSDGEVNNIHFSDVATAEVRRNGVIIT